MRRIALVLLLVLALPGCDKRPEPGAASGPEPRPLAGPDHDAAAAVATAKPAVREVAGIRYIVRFVGGATEGQKLPNIVALHGRGDTPEAYARAFDALTARARLVLAFGSRPYAGSKGYEWFEIRTDVQRTPAEFDAPVGVAEESVAAFLEALPRAEPSIGKPVLTGYSQGAVITHAIAARHPKLIAAGVPVSGFLPPGLAPRQFEDKATLPDLVAFHGDRDPVLSVAWDEASVRSFSALGMHAELRHYPESGHEISDEERATVLALLDADVRRVAGAASP